jgi:Protein of unknown function (DUF3631)
MTEDGDMQDREAELIQQAGQQILEEAARYLDRFLTLPSNAARDWLVLWAAHTWVFRHFTETPRLHMTSVEYGAGKTRTGELISLLCPRPEQMAKITGPAVYHIIAERDPAPLFLDEADALFARGQRAEDTRAILNAGYKSSGKVTRVVKDVATDFPCFCPVIFTGTGQLPRSLADRAISIQMVRRKRKGAGKMERFIAKMHEPLGKKIGRLLGAWVTRIGGEAGDILWDDPPEDLADREVDILTPMFAIAEMAGGDWPQRFAEGVRVVMLGGGSSDEQTPDTALLSAIRDVWPADVERLTTHALADALAGHESGEFAYPQAQRAPELNARMRDLGIPPVPMKVDGKSKRGYERSEVMLEWARLVTPDVSEGVPVDVTG